MHDHRRFRDSGGKELHAGDIIQSGACGTCKITMIQYTIYKEKSVIGGLNLTNIPTGRKDMFSLEGWYDSDWDLITPKQEA